MALKQSHILAIGIILVLAVIVSGLLTANMRSAGRIVYSLPGSSLFVDRFTATAPPNKRPTTDAGDASNNDSSGTDAVAARGDDGIAPMEQDDDGKPNYM